MNYEQETRAAYQSIERARAYRSHLTEEMSWARFAMWREKCCVADAIRLCSVSSDEKVLDVPCGTGIMAKTLEKNCAGRFTAADISKEMMDFAIKEYSSSRLNGLIRADITEMPFREKEFAGAVIIGFMHRVPPVIRQKTLQEVSRVSERFIIASFSVDSLIQRLKQFLLAKLSSRYASAPSPVGIDEIRRECESLNLKVMKRFFVFRGLSSEVIYALKKKLP
jgi:ubiquinone/menaquinone biosynthesis C-methylase UbiE